MKHPVAWHSPAPLWPASLSEAEARTRFRRPEILRFASDRFMEELQATLAEDPGQLGQHRLRSETWHGLDGSLPVPQESVKLYQAAHGRYYVVAASLVCQQPGLPDRAVNLAAGDRVSFVLRRKNGAGEEGWFGQEVGWAAVSPVDSVGDVEARQTLFPVTFQQELQYSGRTKRQPRRLHAALIPVASVETYRAAGRSPIPTATDPALVGDGVQDPRLSEFQAVLDDALRPLRDATLAVGAAAPSSAQAQEVFAFALLDLHLAFAAHLQSVDAALDQRSSAGLTGARLDIYNTLHGAAPVGQWVAWLDQVRDAASALLNGTFAAPHFLSGQSATDIRNAINSLLGMPGADANTLELAIQNALGPFTGSYQTGDESSADPNEQPKYGVRPPNEVPVGGSNAPEYVIRFVYERPQCTRKLEELAGTAARNSFRAIVANHADYKPVVSQPTQPFTLATFFDPDAPQRPIRIPMPVDTSIAGLRKFPRNVSFLLSNKLRQQMQQVGQNLDELGGGDAGGISLGVICSFSIPIITIVALILLILFVFLLNIVFWWLPFFRICFPLGLTVKKS